GLGAVEDFDFIEPPDHRLVNDGRKFLIELGAIHEVQNSNNLPQVVAQSESAVSKQGAVAGTKAKNLAQPATKKAELHNNSLTKIGLQMAKMPIDPRLARMILGGAHFGVLNEVLIIVAALAVQDPRERPADKQMQADQKHALFKEADSDFLFYIKLWNTLTENRETLSESKRRNFAKQHFLSW
ncbi:ATP-dependent helicase, partial [Salmonella enterica subsp. enterica serovar Anatum]|nr:ATP-dependent helicase [Salmonella enterica subsp. enterica serovar Anatum]